MSHGLGSMQRLLLQTVTTMLAEPTMGLFRQPRPPVTISRRRGI